MRERNIRALRYRIANGDKTANWELTGYVIAERIASAKMERDEEHEADRLGLYMAIQAGYHPDFGIQAARTMRERLGEQSKFGAFFSNHPRWTTREQRFEESYPDALKTFTSLWGTAENSPGGLPPTMVRLGELKPVHQGKETVLSTPLELRNLRGKPVQLSVVDESEKGDSPLVLMQRQFAEDGRALPLELSVPDSTLKGRKGKQYVRFVVNQDGTSVYESKRVRIK